MFFLSLSLLFSGCTQEPVTTDILLPVDFSNTPSDMLLTKFQTDKIVIRIQGSPKIIKRISAQDIHYPADLYTDLEFDPAGASQSIQTGNYILPINKSRIPIDSARIIDVSPSSLKVHLEKKISRTLPVRASCTGKPAIGHILMEPACEPPRVKVTGPMAVINNLKEIQTKAIDINQVQKTFKTKVPPDLERNQFTEVSVNMILVTIPIQDKRISRRIKKLPVKVISAHNNASIHPDSIAIKIKGPFEEIGKKKIINKIYAFINIENLPPGVYARHVNINIPVGLEMLEASPQVFTINIPEKNKPSKNNRQAKNGGK